MNYVSASKEKDDDWIIPVVVVVVTSATVFIIYSRMMTNKPIAVIMKLNKFEAARLIRFVIVCMITIQSSPIILLTEATRKVEMNDSNTTFAGAETRTNDTQAQNATQIMQSKLQTSAPYVTLLPQEQRLSHQISIAPEEEQESVGNNTVDGSDGLSGKRAPQDNSSELAASATSHQRKRPYNSMSDLSSLFERNYYVLEPQFSRSKDKLDTLPRTQHRPPWLANKHKPLDAGADGLKLVGKKFKIRVTTIPPTTTTTEFYRLLHSAHSPIKIITVDAQTNSTREYSFAPRATTTTSTTPRPPRWPETTRTTTIRSVTTPRSSDDRSQAPTTAILSAKIGPNKGDGRIVSPTLMVTDGDADEQEIVHKEVQTSKISYDIVDGSSTDSPMGSRRQQQHIDLALRPGEVQTTVISGRKPVTIIRHMPRTTPTPIYVEPPVDIKIDERPNQSILIQDQSPLKNSSIGPPQLVRLIAKQKHKYDDNIVSPTLTVVDNDAIRLPQNATSVHNNKLIVAIRPGRPLKKQPSTTQFPVYNIVAGITPPYPATPSPHPFLRPPPTDGSVYGLMKPNGSEPTTPVPSSNFGAHNIKFPAPPPSVPEMDHHVSMPSNMNISIPDSANLVGPNKVPDKVIVETDEQIERPPSSVVVSDATMVGRPPYGQNTMNQDGIIRLSTTRRPTKLTTTRRINIVSANTTVISTDPDQLHDVLSNVIAGSHPQHHGYQTNQNRPSDRPSVLGMISKLFNAGITTTVIAILTLIKTIFVAILVMFLPPIALTAAIMQAVG